MKKNILSLLFFVFSIINPLHAQETISKIDSPKIKNEVLNSILGNWLEPTTNKWSYGFFEDFVIFDQQYWTYQHVQGVGKGLNIDLTNENGASMKLKLHLQNDSSLVLSSPLEKNVQLQKVRKYLPHYTTADASSFTDSKFVRIDTAYLVGYLRHVPNNTPFNISLEDPILGKQVEYYGDLDSLGRFTVKVPLLNTSQVFLDWRRTHAIAVMQPGETYFFFKDFNTGESLFMGDNERFLNEIVQYAPYRAFPYNPDEEKRTDSLMGMAFLDAKRLELQQANAFSRNYLASLPHPSKKLQYFITHFNKLNIASSLMQKRFQLNRVENERFPEAYLQYVTDSVYLQNVSPLTLVRDNGLFLRDYINYNSSSSSFVSHLDVFQEMVLNGEIKLSGLELEIYDRYLELTSGQTEAEAKVDSVEINSFFISQLPTLLAPYEKQLSSRASEVLFVKNKISFHDSLLTAGILRDIFNTRAIVSHLEHSSTMISEKGLETYLNSIDGSFFKQYAVKENQKFTGLQEVDFRYAENLKNTDHLAESKNADSIIAEILAPHKGKVVYIDFWGTWCAPCRDQMKYVPTVKEALKGKEVVFIYFANNSPETAWSNFIKNNQLEGENVIHYRLPNEQQSLIETRLGVKAFPTYLLIDKKGNFANIAAPSPSAKEQLVSEIDALLERE